MLIFHIVTMAQSVVFLTLVSNHPATSIDQILKEKGAYGNKQGIPTYPDNIKNLTLPFVFRGDTQTRHNRQETKAAWVQTKNLFSKPQNHPSTAKHNNEQCTHGGGCTVTSMKRRAASGSIAGPEACTGDSRMSKLPWVPE